MDTSIQSQISPEISANRNFLANLLGLKDIAFSKYVVSELTIKACSTTSYDNKYVQFSVSKTSTNAPSLYSFAVVDIVSYTLTTYQTFSTSHDNEIRFTCGVVSLIGYSSLPDLVFNQ